MSRKKLLDYGFAERDGQYVYTYPILGGSFRYEIYADEKGIIGDRLIDNDTDEEYVIFRLVDYYGGYVAKIRTECDRVYGDIKKKCFGGHRFEEQQSELICKYIKEKYGDLPEYPFEDENIIFRNKKTGKWYGALLTVKANRVGLEGEAPTEVLNLKDTPERVAEIVDGIGILPAYHMNKKHWYTLRLDGSLPLERICELVDRSYDIINKKAGKH